MTSFLGYNTPGYYTFGLPEIVIVLIVCRPGQTRPDQARPGQTRPDQARPGQTRPEK